MHRYEIIISWSDGDQVFVAEVPELPGCCAHGESQKDALASCQDAIALWLDTARNFGRPIPAPKGRRNMHELQKPAEVPETTLEDLIGCTGYSGPRRSLEDMEEAIARDAKQSR